MKKIKYIVSTVIAVAVAALIIVGCRKENETSNIIEKQPIAKYNRENNTMSYYLDLNKISDNLNKKTTNSKGTTDRFLVESIEVIDEAYDDEEILPEIKVVIIDTEEEVSYTTWLMGNFSHKDIDSSDTYYYFDDDVVAKHYEFVNYEDDKLYAFKVDGNTCTKKEVNPLTYSSFRPKWAFSCRATNCKVGECEKEKVADYCYTCGPCTPPGICKRVGLGQMIREWIETIF